MKLVNALSTEDKRVQPHLCLLLASELECKMGSFVCVVGVQNDKQSFKKTRDTRHYML